jgi:hypothetical protein
MCFQIIYNTYKQPERLKTDVLNKSFILKTAKKVAAQSNLNSGF